MQLKTELSDISSFDFWYFPGMCLHIPLKISSWNIFDCQDDLRAILKLAKEINKHSSFFCLN
jgi:hypothetical protein